MLDGLAEPVEIEKPLPRNPSSPAATRGLSRRDLVTAPARLIRAAREEAYGQVERVVVERPLHPAVRYGVSQALVQGVAMARGVPAAQVIIDEWQIRTPQAPVPVLAQAGHDRYHDAERMIVRRVDSLPGAVVRDIARDFGEDGSELTRYLRWLRNRIEELGGEDYLPSIHLDLQGTLGRIYENRMGPMVGQLYAWQQAADPFPLRIEDPVVLDSRAAQIEVMSTLRDYLRIRRMTVQLVAGAWTNTFSGIGAFIEGEAAGGIHIKMPELGGIHDSVGAVLACRTAGLDALLGGSSAETELSARVLAHVALATQPELLLTKPGLGVDEAISAAQNEMNRIMAQIRISDESDS
jgi:methylaspartate ammonia-lyase